VQVSAGDLATEVGVVLPSNATTNFYFTWQVRDPYPPVGVDLQFHEVRDGERPLIAQGTSGQFTRAACIALEIMNNSAVAVTLELRYGFDQ
jgi:hypothetical protein